MPNLNWISRKHFPNLESKEINSGNCFNWAIIAYRSYYAMCGSVELYTSFSNGGHAFIKINHKYYDAESPLGVKHWKYLKALKNEVRIHKQELKDFLLYWYDHGKYPIMRL